MKIKDFASSIVAVVAVISLAFGAYFWLEKRYALAEELDRVKTRLEQKIKQDRANAIQERLWKIEDRLNDQMRKPTETEKEEIRALQKEKEQLDKELQRK